MSGEKPPLRILCLHGYRQNQRSFHERTGALRKALRGRAELVCVSAPHPVPEHGDARGGLVAPEAGPRGWWFSGPGGDTFDALEEAGACRGLERSLEAVAGALAELGPCQGVLGPCQGAALAALLCALRQRGDARFPFQFAILVAGFKSRAAAHRPYYRSPLAARAGRHRPRHPRRAQPGAGGPVPAARRPDPPRGAPRPRRRAAEARLPAVLGPVLTREGDGAGPERISGQVNLAGKRASDPGIGSRSQKISG